ncbi:PDZ domain-containing protein, partial [Durusdinium trenchii]
ILNSPGDYYDYGNWDAESACPYPAGATEYPTVTTRVREILFKCGFAADLSDKSMVQCEAYYNNFVALGDSITINGTYYKLGIGHGPLKGVRGNCYFMEYEGRYALIFQVDIRSWSFEFTYDTLQYIYNNQGDPGGTCLIPNVQIIDCEAWTVLERTSQNLQRCKKFRPVHLEDLS